MRALGTSEGTFAVFEEAFKVLEARGGASVVLGCRRVRSTPNPKVDLGEQTALPAYIRLYG